MAIRRQTLLALAFAILIVLTAQMTLSVYGRVPSSVGPAYTQTEKGLLIDLRTLVRSAPIPSLADMKAAGFTLVGTYVNTGTNQEWNTIASYLKQVRSAGMRALVMIGAPQLTKYEVGLQWVKKAAQIGADVVELDELVGNDNFTKQQLLSMIDAGLKANPKLQFIVTEFEYPDHALSNVFAWTASYPSVLVANDDYTTIDYIGLEAKLAQQYGKIPITWLMFDTLGSSPTTSYLNLDTWIAYTKQRNVNALFYVVDPWGGWQANWPKAAAF